MKQMTAQSDQFKKKITQGILVGSLSLSLALTGITSGLLTQPIYAQTEAAGRAVTISPPSLPFTVKPGEKKEGQLAVINDSNEDITFAVQAYDMIVQDTQGTPEILPAGTIANNKYSASSWIGVDSTTLLVKAHTRETLRYYVQVPADAGPGGHYAAIVYRPARIETARGSGAAINQQLATLVYFDVAGAIKESAQVKRFEAPGFSEYGPVTLTAEIANFGDTHIRPTGSISVKNMLGKTIATKQLTEANIFPGGISRVIEETVGKKWMFGKYEASITAAYGRNNNLPLVATVAFWVFPWKIAVLVLALIVAAILGYLYMKKHKHKTGTGVSQPVAPKPQEPQNSTV